MRMITKPDEAKRLARTIVSDIVLYNPQKVKEGIEKDSLFEVLTDELAEGKILRKHGGGGDPAIHQLFQ
jgi:hypothetical protein